MGEPLNKKHLETPYSYLKVLCDGKLDFLSGVPASKSIPSLLNRWTLEHPWDINTSAASSQTGLIWSGSNSYWRQGRRSASRCGSGWSRGGQCPTSSVGRVRELEWCARHYSEALSATKIYRRSTYSCTVVNDNGLQPAARFVEEVGSPGRMDIFGGDRCW